MRGSRPVVAIHQPNYAPWLGYFAKIDAADVFVFLDDVQYSKNNYINRVQILGPSGPRWLTIPVSYHFGDPITAVLPASREWASAHLDTLRAYYRDALAFAASWPDVEAIYRNLPDGSLAEVNIALVRALAVRLGISAEFRQSSAINVANEASGARLVELVRTLAPGGTYLSGRGGAKYQDPDAFHSAGLGFRYTSFVHPSYSQRGGSFTPGLSVLDAIFHLGWAETGALLRRASAPVAA
jgi:hypothetical protein